MTKKGKRQQVVDKSAVEGLTSGGSVIAGMVRELGGEGGRKKKGKKAPPSERERKDRRLITTFSDAAIPDRIRALAEQWGLETKGRLPNTSAVVEHLLLPRLLAAERGEIDPPEPKE